MARLAPSLLAISFALFLAVVAAYVLSPTDFIKASCMTTSYPALCVQCLVGYANSIQQDEQHLVLTALSVSLATAKSIAAFVTKMANVRGIRPREYQAVKDCIENMGDSIDRLSQSISDLGHMGGGAGQDFTWHMSNVQTWVSAALTDENTCLDGFAGLTIDGNVEAAIGAGSSMLLKSLAMRLPWLIDLLLGTAELHQVKIPSILSKQCWWSICKE